jgi:hypothetical protein
MLISTFTNGRESATLMRFLKIVQSAVAAANFCVDTLPSYGGPGQTYREYSAQAPYPCL